MSTSAVRPSDTSLTRYPLFVEVSATSRDLTLGVKKEGVSSIRLSGTASNQSSELIVRADGRPVRIPLSRGTTPMAAFEALEKVVPRGYQAKLVSAELHRGGDVVIEITKQAQPAGSGISKLPTRVATRGSGQTSVDANLWIEVSPFFGKIPPRELRPLHASVSVKGVKLKEATHHTFQVRSIKVYEQLTGKLVHTVQGADLLEARVGRGRNEQTYKFQLPRDQGIDPGKSYTFVVSTEVNGSKKPVRVRSEYVPMGMRYV